MKLVFLICKKEFKSYFVSPIAYLLMAFFGLIFGFALYTATRDVVRMGFQAQMMGQSQPVNLNDMIIRPLLGFASTVSVSYTHLDIPPSFAANSSNTHAIASGLPPFPAKLVEPPAAKYRWLRLPGIAARDVIGATPAVPALASARSARNAFARACPSVNAPARSVVENWHTVNIARLICCATPGTSIWPFNDDVFLHGSLEGVCAW